MKASEKLATRRRVLKGILGGGAVTVALPFLDCFLNSRGTALAAAPNSTLPSVFSTWYWGLGLNPGRWEPPAVGKITSLGPEMQPLEKFKEKINVYSGMSVMLDGRPLKVHNSGGMGALTGSAPRVGAEVPQTIDSIIADQIGNGTRFKSLEMTSTGNARYMYSYRAGGVFQAGEPSPAAMYARLFGAEFRDPNAASFTPDPQVMARRSVLSAVSEQRSSLEKQIGASDRARLDQYFTSLRQIEQQVDLMLQKPAPLESCSKPDSVPEMALGAEVDQAAATHKLHALLAAHAFACDQTRVASLLYSDFSSAIYRRGSQMTHHIFTHEEPIDEKLGYQPSHAYFATRAMGALSDYLAALDGIREGDGTLLDRALIYCVTDTSYAKTHSIDRIPQITAGRANGRMKTGLHFATSGDPVTRVGLTVQQAMGLSLNSWGGDSMKTSKSINEVLV
jgi:hypothetical protein